LRLQILAEIRERLLGLCIAAATAAGVTPDRLAAEVSAGELGVCEAAERLIEAFLRT
jgi:hypothetical protein